MRWNRSAALGRRARKAIHALWLISPRPPMAPFASRWKPAKQMTEPSRISQADFSSMFWTLGQMITHHSSNGCPLRAGDLIGSGTVSGPEKDNRGCLLEITSRGAEPVTLPSGETRSFLEDGDEVVLRAFCQAPGFRRIGLGECRGVVLPAHAAVSRL